MTVSPASGRASSSDSNNPSNGNDHVAVDVDNTENTTNQLAQSNLAVQRQGHVSGDEVDLGNLDRVIGPQVAEQVQEVLNNPPNNATPIIQNCCSNTCCLIGTTTTITFIAIELFAVWMNSKCYYDINCHN